MEGVPRVILKIKGVDVDFGESPQWRKSSHALASPSAGDMEVAFSPDGHVATRSSAEPNGTILTFTPQEWDAFVSGAKAGEFNV